MKKILAIIFMGFFAITNNAIAVEPVIYFNLEKNSFAVGEEFSLKIYLDSEIPINAYQIAIEFTPESAEFIGSNDANSIIDIWQSRPKLSGQNFVAWTGGSRTAFSGRGGELITLRFKSKKAGQAGFGLRGSNLYAADGEATEITTKPFYIKVDFKNGQISQNQNPKDSSSPKLDIVVFDTENNSKAVLAYAADKESGIQGVYFRNWENWWWGEWKEADGAIKINNNSLVQFKAINNNNQANVQWILGRNIKVIGGGIMVLFGLLLFAIIRRRINKPLN